uniref:Uncharacterized protein n=1 Tax=Glossina pallidipes TaxID=7398 RepID=A0A1A9ZDB8_GLOPL
MVSTTAPSIKKDQQISTALPLSFKPLKVWYIVPLREAHVLKSLQKLYSFLQICVLSSELERSFACNIAQASESPISSKCQSSNICRIVIILTIKGGEVNGRIKPNVPIFPNFLLIRDNDVFVRAGNNVFQVSSKKQISEINVFQRRCQLMGSRILAKPSGNFEINHYGNVVRFQLKKYGMYGKDNERNYDVWGWQEFN